MLGKEIISCVVTFTDVFPHFDTMAHIKSIFKSIRQLGSFTLYSSVTNSTHQPIKKLSVFSDTDLKNLWSYELEILQDIREVFERFRNIEVAYLVFAWLP